MMYSPMATAVDRLDSCFADDPSILDWSCPVPFFGDISSARIATVGINPSNREFVDASGHALDFVEQRLPTLGSLGVACWGDVDATHVRAIVLACRGYFERNPYDRWFGVLERVLRLAGVTYYGTAPSACHVDLVPYATVSKWGNLNPTEQQRLLDLTGDALGRVLRESSVETLVLNGRSVVTHFASISDVGLESRLIPEWQLPRSAGSSVEGTSYVGVANTVGGVHLASPIRVLGYNHNLQSSFGVTSGVIAAIGSWLREFLHAEAGQG